jgi:prepilin-type N-terminal cleavage/methylation domain-containing protein
VGKKKNNSGFSLVELIVTVTILAIIVVPLLRAFVISAQTNAKAKERLRATDLAQNIMENMEAYGLETLSEQVNAQKFRLLIGTTGAVADGSCELHRDSASSAYFSVATIKDTVSEFGFVNNIPATASSVLVDEAAGTYEFRGSQNEDKCYYFAVGGIESDGKKYDALIVASPAAAGSNGRDVNTSDLAEISAISSETSHVASYSYSDAISDMQNIINKYDGEIFDSAGNNLRNYANYKSHIQRTVTVALEGTTEITGVTVTYSYDLESGYKTGNGKSNLLVRTDTVFSSAGDDDAQMEKMYLMLYPWYNGNRNLPDTIVVSNPNNLSADIILAQQTKLEDDTRTEASNLLYAMDIRVMEKAESNGTMSSHTHVNIRPQISGDISLSWNREQYISDSYGITHSTDSSEMTADLVETTQEGRNFDVTVCIYPVGTLFDGTEYKTSFRRDAAEAYSTFTGGLVY